MALGPKVCQCCNVVALVARILGSAMKWHWVLGFLVTSWYSIYFLDSLLTRTLSSDYFDSQRDFSLVTNTIPSRPRQKFIKTGWYQWSCQIIF